MKKITKEKQKKLKVKKTKKKLPVDKKNKVFKKVETKLKEKVVEEKVKSKMSEAHRKAISEGMKKSFALKPKKLRLNKWKEELIKLEKRIELLESKLENKSNESKKIA